MVRSGGELAGEWECMEKMDNRRIGSPEEIDQILD